MTRNKSNEYISEPLEYMTRNKSNQYISSIYIFERAGSIDELSNTIIGLHFHKNMYMYAL